MMSVLFIIIPAMIYRVMPLSLILTLAGGHEVSAKQNPLVFSSTFQLIRMKLDVVLKLFKLNMSTLFVSEMYRNKGENAVSLTTSKTSTLACIWIFTNRFGSHLAR